MEIHKAALSPLSVMLSELRAKEAASPRTKGPAPVGLPPPNRNPLSKPQSCLNLPPTPTPVLIALAFLSLIVLFVSLQHCFQGTVRALPPFFHLSCLLLTRVQQEEKKAEPFYAVEHPLPLPPLVPNDRDFELHKTLGLATLEAKNKALELEERRLEVDRRRLDAQERLWAEQAHAARIAGLAALLPHCPEALPRLRDCLEHYQPHQ